MMLASLRVCHVSATTLDWYAAYVAEIDARASDHALAYVANDCVIQVNDALPIYGKVAFARSLAEYFETFSRIEHELVNIYGADQNFCVELLCHYTPAGAANGVTIPAAALYDRNSDGLISSIRLYVSGGGMFEAFTGAAA